MLTILGPTASGKTSLAARLAYDLNGEVISADSRQVYKGMDIGTGKDYDDYIVFGKKISFHLIDIVDPGYEYNVFEYQQDFVKVYRDIIGRGKLPILCGGSGMYLEAILRGYEMKKLQYNASLKKSLESKTEEELKNILKELRNPHNMTDLIDRKRMIKAIEIASLDDTVEGKQEPIPSINAKLFGIQFERETLRNRITERLKARLRNGMIDEVQYLMDKGLTASQLKFYGLEYRYITQFLEKEFDFDSMFRLLNTAIHQFAKRQMTWFRRMERNGFDIHWIDGTLDPEMKIEMIEAGVKQF